MRLHGYLLLEICVLSFAVHLTFSTRFEIDQHGANHHTGAHEVESDSIISHSVFDEAF